MFIKNTIQLVAAGAVTLSSAMPALAERNNTLPAALAHLSSQDATALSDTEAAAVRGEAAIVGAVFQADSIVFAQGFGNITATAGGTTIGLAANPNSLVAKSTGRFQSGTSASQPNGSLRPDTHNGRRIGDYLVGKGFLYNTRTGQGVEFGSGSFVRYNGAAASASLFGQGFLTNITVQGNGVLTSRPNSLQFSSGR